jgi:hypothetical protein
MSALGHKQTLEQASEMSALPTKADMRLAVQKCPLCAMSGRELRSWASPAAHLLALAFFESCVRVENISQVAMSMAAITGPITNPLRPKIAIPPSVEIKALGPEAGPTPHRRCVP